MATSGSRNDPLASFNFIVKIENMELGFSEIGGLSTETDIIEYREGSEEPHMRKLPGRRSSPTSTSSAATRPTAKTCGTGARR